MGTIEITSLSRRFANTTAVDDVSLTVEDGDFLVLLGPSGCGKTTLLRMIAGLLEPTSGRLVLDGRDITREPSKRRDLAMVFQSYALYPHLTVEKNLGFPLRVQRVAKSEIARRVREVAVALEIEHLLSRRPKELSGGQRQRVAVGRALVRNPAAFLMDEPLSNLDAKLRTATRQELTSLHRRLGATFVYVTHDQVEAMTMATRIAVLNAGRLEQIGTPADVYDRPASAFVAGFLGAPAMNLVDAAVSSRDGRIRVTAEGIEGELWAGGTEEFDATLGVRPEHWSIVPEGEPAASGAAVVANGVIDTVENLGSEEIVYCTTGAHRIAVRMLRTDTLVVGERVRLEASLEHVHLFDEKTGRRLEWVADEATTDADTTATTAGAVTPAEPQLAPA
jgi:multiple sugar transport system ATP-binding protein